MSEKNYLVAGCKPWSHVVFDEIISRYDGRWEFIGDRSHLNPSLLARLQPRYIFFLHWSWIVPEEIVTEYECVCFHMTDVPYGRGGSPLQNLILAGATRTKLTALRMISVVDAGPVYGKEDLALDGSANDIFLRANRLAAGMISRIAREEPVPTPQVGEPTVFKRRRPEESRLPNTGTLSSLFDFIRMLDAPTYPRAFLENGHFRYEFSSAHLDGDELIAQVTIRPTKGSGQ